MAITYYQVFCDESGKYQQDPLVAFSGVCATADRLSGFDKEWRSLLHSYELADFHMARLSRLCEDHGYQFKKGQTVDERTDALVPFADCINKHLEIGLIQAWDVKGFNHLPHAALTLLGGSNDPFFLAFVRGLAEVAGRVGEDDKISIICDDDPYTAWDCYNHYRSIGKADPGVQKKAVSFSFANDKHFPALQAADMVAFLARQEAEEKFFGKTNIWRRLFNRLTTEPEYPYGVMRWFTMFADERQLVNFANEMNELLEKKKAEKIKQAKTRGRTKT